MAVTDEQIIKALKQWGKPTVARYREHVAACANLGLDAEPFIAFAADVFGCPEDKRDWLLTPEPIPESAPLVRFRQYDSPLQKEMPTGLFYRDYRKGKK